MRSKRTQQICETAIFIALVFLGTFLLKIPLPLGYTHLGDCMIVLAVLMMGGRRGALAGGIGAALADLVSGYAIWAVPSLVCKTAMALIMGLMLEKHAFGLQGRPSWIVSGICGGLVQCAGYLVFWRLLFGRAAMIAAIVPLGVQTGLGIGIAFAIGVLLSRTALRSHFISAAFKEETVSLKGEAETLKGEAHHA
ncbi:MAG: ECF transporter S component [Anaerovoracaceae bacterium]|jgi:uncharacterized membrane protein